MNAFLVIHPLVRACILEGNDSLLSDVSLVSLYSRPSNQADVEQLLAAYPETLTVTDVARVLRVHERSVQRWAREGRVASVRVGRSYRFLRSDVLRLLRAARIEVNSALWASQEPPLPHEQPSV